MAERICLYSFFPEVAVEDAVSFPDSDPNKLAQLLVQFLLGGEGVDLFPTAAKRAPPNDRECVLAEETRLPIVDRIEVGFVNGIASVEGDQHLLLLSSRTVKSCSHWHYQYVPPG